MLLPWADGDTGERVPVSQGRCRATGRALSEASSRTRLSVPTVSSAVLCCPPAMDDKRWPWLEVHQQGGSHWVMEGAAMSPEAGWVGMPSLPAPTHRPNVSTLVIGMYWAARG